LATKLSPRTTASNQAVKFQYIVVECVKFGNNVQNFEI
jgi:hypothetical protein